MSIGRLERLYVDRMVDYLSQKAQQIIDKAEQSRNTPNKNVSFNQLDAYGYAIWYKGNLEKKGTGDPGHGRYAEGPHKGYGDIPEAFGSEWADMFISEFPSKHPLPKNAFCLVVFNAAFYSRILEEGGGGVKKRYQIISQVIGDLDSLGKEFNAPPSKKL